MPNYPFCLIFTLIRILPEQKGENMRHRHTRLSLHKKIAFVWQHHSAKGAIENISYGGALVSGSIPVEVGDYLAFRLEDPSLPISLELSGNVVRLDNDLSGKPTFAVKFQRAPHTLKVLMHRIFADRARAAQMEQAQEMLREDRI
jgi:hypothetical protein